MFSVKALFLIALAGFAAASPSPRGRDHDGGKYDSTRKPRNFIMVVPDGFGVASETMARDYMHWKNNATTVLPIDQMVIGLVRTRASNSYVTDSAASATAYSCGIKSYNGAIGVGDDFMPCGTVLEAAHLQGFKTGLVVTSRITHATPATFVAHVYDRDEEANIALQTIGHAHPLGRTVDVLLGGGRCYFTPKSTPGSCRKDDIDALQLARGLGYTVFSDRRSFDAARPSLPYLGLFADDHLAYDADRDPAKEPSLKEMALRALDDLYAATRHSKRGFFIMVEASRIDHAGHVNDPVGHLMDILAYNEAMDAMRQWIDKHAADSPTTLISTADHECGGLTVGRQLKSPPDYWYAPEHFAGSRATPGPLYLKFAAYNGSDAKAFLRNEVFAPYGIGEPTDAELDQAVTLKTQSSDFQLFLAGALSNRLLINWSTLGHTAADVTLFGYGATALQFAGSHENNEVGRFIASQLGLDLAAVTRRISHNSTWLKDWVLPPKGDGKSKAVRRSLALHHH